MAQIRNNDDYQTPEVIRPGDLVGWSSARGRDLIEHDDYQYEFGQNKHVISDNNHNLLENVRRQPGDKPTPNMEELTTSWMNDPNSAAVADRLQSLDEEAWASSAHQASRSTMREVLSDIIGEETDKLNAEKRDEAAFHPDYMINSADYSKE